MILIPLLIVGILITFVLLLLGLYKLNEHINQETWQELVEGYPTKELPFHRLDTQEGPILRK